MNLVVVRADGTFYARPDTTLVRGVRDYYLPDDLTWVEIRPCCWIRILKSAKAVQERFAQRYYDAIGSGLLLYGDGTDTLLDASTYIFDDAAAVVMSASGHSSGGTDKPFRESPAIPDVPSPDLVQRFDAALSAVTAHLLLHQGDLLILEASDSTTLHRGETHPSAGIRVL